MSTDNDICLAWLAEVLRRARAQGQARVVSFLEAVSEEVLFETKMVSRPPGSTFRTEGL